MLLVFSEIHSSPLPVQYFFVPLAASQSQNMKDQPLARQLVMGSFHKMLSPLLFPLNILLLIAPRGFYFNFISLEQFFSKICQASVNVPLLTFDVLYDEDAGKVFSNTLS